MPEKLFVGGLPFDFSDDQLRGLFAKAGTVLSAIMVPDPKNKRTRGFGFVTLSGKEEALAAIEMLNGTPIGEKKIFVTEAREKTPRQAPPAPRHAPSPSRGPRFPPMSRDEKRSAFRGPRRERRPPHDRSGKPAKTPFYQKFAKPE
jgi:RNA recognition motif-containing protein